MSDALNVPAAVITLKALITEIEARLQHPEAYSERERRQQTELLRHRRLELADLLDQHNDPGDLP